jgi:hypothetical protein
MSEWYRSIFRDAGDESELVPLFNMRTSIGTWEILTPIRTFKFHPIKQKHEYYLALEGGDYAGPYFDIFNGVKAVCNHTTGVEEWDSSNCQASDYLGDWSPAVVEYVVYNYIDQWIRNNPHGSLRSMVDYFHHDGTHLVKRKNISDFLKEMITTGQIDSLPSDFMVPSELTSVVRLAKKYGIPIGSKN